MAETKSKQKQQLFLFKIKVMEEKEIVFNKWETEEKEWEQKVNVTYWEHDFEKNIYTIRYTEL